MTTEELMARVHRAEYVRDVARRAAERLHHTLVKVTAERDAAVATDCADLHRQLNRERERNRELEAALSSLHGRATKGGSY